MRKLIESTFVSADGVVADPPLWAMEYRDEEVDADALKRFSSSDAMLMGLVTYEFFAAIWPSMTGDFADRVNSIVSPAADDWQVTVRFSDAAHVEKAVPPVREHAGRTTFALGSGTSSRCLPTGPNVVLYQRPG
jgi:dihydrofolate reductase